MGSLDWRIDLLDNHQAVLQILTTLQKVTVTAPHKIKTTLLISVCLLSSFVFCVLLVTSLREVGSCRTVWRAPPSTVEFSRFQPLLCFNRFVAVWTETFLYTCTLPRNRRLCMQCIASPVVFVVVETCPNKSPSISGFTYHNIFV
jgi:hypothetical protein